MQPWTGVWPNLYTIAYKYIYSHKHFYCDSNPYAYGNTHSYTYPDANQFSDANKKTVFHSDNYANSAARSRGRG